MYIKAQKRARFHVYSPFSASFYPPLHHKLIHRCPLLLPPAPPTLSVPLPPEPQPFIPYGMPITLACEATGLDIEWVWYYNGAELDSTGPTHSIESAVEEDTGIYQCSAYNPAGFDSSTTFVNVTSELLGWEIEGDSVIVFIFTVFCQV